MLFRCTLCLLLLLTACAARAQSDVHRCVGTDGGMIFTDQPCSSMQATPEAAAPHIGTTPVVHGICPLTLAELKQRIGTAFKSADTNALAGLMQWRGYDQGSALAVMRQLDTLIRQPLLGIEEGLDDYGSMPAPASTSPDPGITPTLTLHLGDTLDTDATTFTFDVIDRDGCLWLQP